MTLSEVLLASEFKITGSCQFLWPCFGPNAGFIDIGHDDDQQVASVVFDRLTQQVYSLEIFAKTQAWQWIESNYYQAYVNECVQRHIDSRIAFGRVQFQSVDQAAALILINQLIKQDPQE